MTILAAPKSPREQRPQRAGTVRRVVRLDTTWPDGSPGDPSATMHVRAVAIDTVMDHFGKTRLVDRAEVVTDLAPGHLVTSITCSPELEASDVLVGRRAASGWRPMVHGLTGGVGPLAQLLDDLPVAILVAGYAGIRTGNMSAMSGDAKFETAKRMVDVCAGWAREGQAFIAISGRDDSLTPALIPAPSWKQWDGAAGVLPQGQIRRERRIDVWRTELGLQAEATFRDTFCDPDSDQTAAAEGILHEYVVELAADAQGRITELSAEPRVLPYGECPSAVRAVADLVGERVDELARLVPEILVGTASCTHLNDLLRSLSATPRLLEAGDADEASSGHTQVVTSFSPTG